MRKPQFVALLIVASTLTLAACGQKGPLYLPTSDAMQSAEVPDDTAADTTGVTDKKEKVQKKSTY